MKKEQVPTALSPEAITTALASRHQTIIDLLQANAQNVDQTIELLKDSVINGKNNITGAAAEILKTLAEERDALDVLSVTYGNLLIAGDEKPEGSRPAEKTKRKYTKKEKVVRTERKPKASKQEDFNSEEFLANHPDLQTIVGEDANFVDGVITDERLLEIMLGKKDGSKYEHHDLQVLSSRLKRDYLSSNKAAAKSGWTRESIISFAAFIEKKSEHGKAAYKLAFGAEAKKKTE